MVDTAHARISGKVADPVAGVSAWVSLVPTDYSRSISGKLTLVSTKVTLDSKGNIVDENGNAYVDVVAPSPSPNGGWPYAVLIHSGSGYSSFTTALKPGTEYVFSELIKISGEGTGGGGGAAGPKGDQGPKGDTGAGFLVLGLEDPIPDGTPAGTVIARLVS